MNLLMPIPIDNAASDWVNQIPFSVMLKFSLTENVRKSQKRGVRRLHHKASAVRK